MSQQIIKKVELYRLSVPLIEPFSTSLGTEYAAKNVLVRLFTEEGLIGLGECIP